MILPSVSVRLSLDHFASFTFHTGTPFHSNFVCWYRLLADRFDPLSLISFDVFNETLETCFWGFFVIPVSLHTRTRGFNRFFFFRVVLNYCSRFWLLFRPSFFITPFFERVRERRVAHVTLKHLPRGSGSKLYSSTGFVPVGWKILQSTIHKAERERAKYRTLVRRKIAAFAKFFLKSPTLCDEWVPRP